VSLSSLVLVALAPAHADAPPCLNPAATTTLPGADPRDLFGAEVQGVGDIEGDGYDDVLVSAYGHAESTGQVFLYSGSASGLQVVPSATLEGPVEGGYFGVSTAGADLNGDGHADVLVGASYVGGVQGQVRVYLGSASGLQTAAAVVLDGPSPAAVFGHSVASAGDVDGDGYEDVLIGAYGADDNEGAAWLYRGGPDGLSPSRATRLAGRTEDGRFGGAVAGVGDLDGDGYDDVAVGAAGLGQAPGKVYLYHGSSAGLSERPKTVLRYGSNTSYFGAAVAGAGDLDGDGYDDLIVGMPGEGDGVGAAVVYRGSPRGVSPDPLGTLTGVAAGGAFGEHVAGVGDLDGDGYPELAVGAWLANDAAGAVYLFSGEATCAILAGPRARASFGAGLAGAGDVDGDGGLDLIVGTMGNFGLVGSAMLYRGFAPQADPTAPSGQETPDRGCGCAQTGGMGGWLLLLGVLTAGSGRSARRAARVPPTSAPGARPSRSPPRATRRPETASGPTRSRALDSDRGSGAVSGRGSRGRSCLQGSTDSEDPPSDRGPATSSAAVGRERTCLWG
jgi:hypothetical protein